MECVGNWLFSGTEKLLKINSQVNLGIKIEAICMHG